MSKYSNKECLHKDAHEYYHDKNLQLIEALQRLADAVRDQPNQTLRVVYAMDNAKDILDDQN